MINLDDVKFNLTLNEFGYIIIQMINSGAGDMVTVSYEVESFKNLAVVTLVLPCCCCCVAKINPT